VVLVHPGDELCVSGGPLLQRHRWLQLLLLLRLLLQILLMVLLRHSLLLLLRHGLRLHGGGRGVLQGRWRVERRVLRLRGLLVRLIARLVPLRSEHLVRGLLLLLR